MLSGGNIIEFGFIESKLTANTVQEATRRWQILSSMEI
jgi:hypothetical protein